MATLNAIKFLFILFIIIPGFLIRTAQQPKTTLYGTWTTDKPLYDKTMEIAFDKNGKYAETTKNAKTNLVISKVEAGYVIVNDSTIVVTTPTEHHAYRMHFMTKDLLRFYWVKRKNGDPILPLYMYNFVRKK